MISCRGDLEIRGKKSENEEKKPQIHEVVVQQTSVIWHAKLISSKFFLVLKNKVAS